MERGRLTLNRGTAVILVTACIAMALLATSCGGGGNINVAATLGPSAPGLSPSSLAFASPAVGAATAAQTITLTNSGNADLSVSSIAVSGANAGDFTQSNNCGSSVPAGSNCAISVTFKPYASGTRTAAVAVSDNASGGPQTVALSGSISATLASISPSSLALGNQPLSTASPTQAITLTNAGSADLNVTSVAVSGANASDFIQTNNCGSSVAAGSSCNISVTFKPVAAGTRTASVVVADSAPTSPQTVPVSGIGDAPVASVSSPTVTFGNQSVGVTGTAQAVTLSNTGNAPLNITSAAVFGTNAGDFAQTNNCPIALAAGANCTIGVTFTPTAAGSRAASLAITDNAAGSPQSVSLSGTGTSIVASVSPTSLAFGNQSVGAASAAQAVTLTNPGNSALTISSIAVFGTNATDFAQTNNCPIALAAGANCTVGVTFTPTAAGSRAASLAITDNATGSPQAVSLSGTGVSTGVTVSPTSLAFGNQSVGATSAAQAVTLTNTGNSALTVTSIAVFGTNSTDFVQTNNCGSSVAAGANCTISVTLTPSASGSRAASLAMTDNATGSPQAVSLSGTGTSIVASFSPTSLSFVSQAVGANSAAQAITLTNSGNATLSITSIALSGTNASDFSQTNNCGSSVTAGSICTINVTFKPTAAGTRTAAVTLTDNATGSPQTVPLSGTIATTIASASPSSLSFATQPVGTTSASQAITLANTGNASLSISSLALSGANASDFAQTNNCGSSVAAGANCTISVTFTPAASGTRSAAVTLTDNATGSPQTASLTGTGTAPAVSISPTSLTFTSQVVGTASAAQPITLNNTGNSAMSITSIALTGANASDFTQTNTCGSSLAASASCSASVTFRPAASGSRTASLSITDNVSGSPQAVTLSGTGTSAAAAVSLSSTSLAFGNQSVGTTSTAQTITLTNSGNASLSISSLALSGANASDFAQTNNCGSSVAAGANCTISVTFTPAASGTRSAAVTLTDNATGSPQTASLTGTGTAPVAGLSPSSLTFGNEAVGTTSSSQVVILNNTGNTGLTLASISITGANATDFTQVDTCGNSVAAGGNCTIAIMFTPSATGARVASLSITDNASGSPQPISLSGTGTQPGPTGNTYYVDNCVFIGSDSNNGTSTATPWLTVNKVNTSTFNPGDSILFESTCTWREQLTVPSSGSAGSPITFGAYGTGSQPIISGADIFSSWITEGSLYYSPASVQPNQVFLDNQRLTLAASKAALATGQWWWDSTNNRVYVYDNPSGQTIEASQRTYGVLNTMDYIAVQNLNVQSANTFGVGFQNYWNALHWGSISGVNAQNNYQDGIAAYDSGNSNSISNVSISDNETSGNGIAGIDIFTEGATLSYISVSGNVSHDDIWRTDHDSYGSIHVFGSTVNNLTVEYNLMYNSGSALPNFKNYSSLFYSGAGIYIDTVGSGAVIAYNELYNNNLSGFVLEATNGAVVYGNLAYDNGQTGFRITRLGSYNLFYNNTSYGNGVAFQNLAFTPTAGCLIGNQFINNIGVGSTVFELQAGGGGENDGTYGYGNVYAYNDFGPQTTNFIEWGASLYESTYSAWETAPGNCGTMGCSHSVQADPQFVNASAAQFWLQATSPAIAAGAKLGSPYNIDLLPGSSWPNSVATGDQNNYGTGWEVGAYIFTGQTVQ